MFLKDAHIIFSKNTTLLKDVNRVINENLVEIRKISEKYLIIFKNMYSPQNCVKTSASLKLIPYWGMLIIYAILIIVSIIVFYVEFLTDFIINLRRSCKQTF
jgi:hypothetical protein